MLEEGKKGEGKELENKNCCKLKKIFLGVFGQFLRLCRFSEKNCLVFHESIFLYEIGKLERPPSPCRNQQETL